MGDKNKGEALLGSVWKGVLITTSDGAGSPTVEADETKVIKGATNINQIPEGLFKLAIDKPGGGNLLDTVATCQSISELSMKRKVQEYRSGGEPEKVYYSAGDISYTPVKLKSIYTDSKMFIDWIMNGANYGSVLKENLVITLLPNKTHKWTITLNDAFPTEWKLSDITVASGTDAKPMFETITFAYSSISFEVA